jgi:hypothetical protein
MAVWPCTHAIIVVLHDDGLLAGIPAGQEDHHLAGLQQEAAGGSGLVRRGCLLPARRQMVLLLLSDATHTLRNFTMVLS